MLKDTFTIGQRVKTHPATNSWMQGDKYGTVSKIGRLYIHVKLDRSGKTKAFDPSDVLDIEAAW